MPHTPQRQLVHDLLIDDIGEGEEPLGSARDPNVIARYENWARRALGRAGLLEWDGYERSGGGRWKSDSGGRSIDAARIRRLRSKVSNSRSVEWFAVHVLAWTRVARKALERKRSFEAAHALARLVKHGTLGAFVQRLERESSIGATVREGGNAQRESRAKHDSWILEAAKMREKDPSLKGRKLAKAVAEKVGAHFETVRTVLRPSKAARLPKTIR